MDIHAWLKEEKISADVYDTEMLLAGFLNEMERGLNGAESSLAMIPSYIGIRDELPASAAVAVIDAGGTNLRIGLARIGADGAVELTGLVKQEMPGRDRETGADEFYAVLADALVPVADQFESIGFCFSYPTAIQPDLDGRLLCWTKGIRIPDLVGTCVGAGLLQALADRGVHGKQVVVLNDTVAALLAGRAECSAASYIGFILGTGTNTAYLEKNGNISKLNPRRQTGAQVINVESGAFSRFERGAIEQALDARREDAGQHVFEKTLSGAYLGSLTLELLKALAEHRVFSPAGSAALAGIQELSTMHIDNLNAARGGETGELGTDAFTESDRAVMKTVFSALVNRAALFTAVNIAAAVIKCGEGHDPEHPVCINIDGSTYYKTSGLAEKVQTRLSRILDARGLHYRCVHVEDAPAAGAAMAAISAYA
jgi:hexokinase